MHEDLVVGYFMQNKLSLYKILIIAQDKEKI